MQVSFHDSSLGRVLIATEQDILFGIEIGEDDNQLYQNFLRRKFSAIWLPIIVTNNSKKIINDVLSILDGNIIHKCESSIILIGTEFQQKVWRFLINNVKFGTTISYKEIANQIGHPNASRAVGTACKNNPIAVIIPCHRVIASNGKNTGYRWGIEIKNKLLEREQRIINLKSFF